MRPLAPLPTLLFCGALLGLAACSDAPPASSDAALHRATEGDAEQLTRNLQTFGKDLDHAVEIAPGIFQARGVGNAHMVVTPSGNVVVDTGLVTEGERLRDLLRAADDGPVSHVVVTHGHMDHVGGAGAWMQDGVELVAHREIVSTQAYLQALAPFLLRRNQVFYPNEVPDVPFGLMGPAIKALYPVFEPTQLMDHRLDLEVGGTRFEILHTPGAEGADNICVWLPEQRILFTGDFFGPIFPMLPNLYTIRGEKFRFAMDYVRSLDVLMALEPEIIVPSHFEPIVGWEEQIRPGMQRTRDAVLYLHDATVDGMNAGRDVHTLMREIRLPAELELSQAHGLVPWVVRGIWEGYAGWFHFRSTTELYGVPVRTVYPEVVDLAGGPDALAQRAQGRVEAGQPLEALHLAEMALEADPRNRPALQAQLAALQAMQQRVGDVNHHEYMWLRHRVRQVREQLGLEGAEG